MNLDRPTTIYRSLVLLLYGLGVGISVLGLVRFESSMEDVFQWLPDESADREVYNRFVDQFGVDDFVVVSWSGCTIANPELDVVADRLRNDGTAGLIAKVSTGRDLLRELAGKLQTSPAKVYDRFRGVYFGPDRRTTCLLVGLSRLGMQQRGESIALIQRLVSDSTGVPADELVLAGYPQVGAFGDQLVRGSIIELVLPCCLISTVVAWFCLGRLMLTLLILAVGALSVGLSLAVVTLSGASWGLLSSVIPALAYVLFISGTLHLVNYARQSGSERLLIRVLRIGWKPCLMSGVTTIVGMLSLSVSQFPAVRQFGVFCAAGVLVSLGCQLVFVPCVIDLLGAERLPRRSTAVVNRFFDRMLPWSSTVVALVLAGTVVAGLGLTRLHSNLEIERSFARRTKMIRDIAWMEQHLGPIEQTELLIRFDNVSAEGFARRLQTVRTVEQQLVATPFVERAISASRFLPTEPSGASLRQTAARAAYRSLLRQRRHEMQTSPYLQVAGTSETWRISTRFPFLRATPFQQLQIEVPQAAIAAIASELPQADVAVEHTGVSLLYHVAQEKLVADLYRNFGLAFMAIVPLMVIALKSVRQGLLAMIPNLCPAVIAFGVLGWVEYPIDLAMAITACVALGIAVDDTTHFMLRTAELRKDPQIGALAAIRGAYQQCSLAMTQTTLIVGWGLTAFLVSPLTAMTRFSALLISLMIIALLCDLVLLPCLLLVWRRTGTVGLARKPAADSL